MANLPRGLTPTRLPLTVIVVSWVSFLNDAASDMVIPLLPLLFAGSFGGGALALGLGKVPGPDRLLIEEGD